VIIQGTHSIRYEYEQAILPSVQILKLQPQNTASQHLKKFHTVITPTPTGTTEIQDLENNHVLSASFSAQTLVLEFQTSWTVETLLTNPFNFVLGPDNREKYLRTNPLNRHAAFLMSHFENPPCIQFTQLLTELQSRSENAQQFVQHANNWIYENIAVVLRIDGDIQTPEETLKLRSGACRDSSVFLMELCRGAGIPARFVSGYCFHDGEHTAHELHSWAEAWIPYGGWRGYDPTLGLACTDHHIILCAAADPADTLPVEGGIIGDESLPQCKLSYEVNLSSAE